jgi:leader peptidase (prepilin peptidase) / N-methyltransferase
MTSPTLVITTATAAAAATGAATAPVTARLLKRAAAPIPVPATAALAALGVAAITAGWLAGALPGWWLPVPVLLTVVAVPLALADLRHLRLPDVLTLPAYPLFGAALGAAVLGGGGPSLVVRAAAGALLFGGAHALVRRVAPASLGAGDVKLSGSLGAVLGAAGWPALALAAVLAAPLSLAVAIVRGRGRVPHGPALLTATWLCVLFPAAP